MAAAEEKRVAPLELFFDLVFVFAITQVTALMAARPAPGTGSAAGCSSWRRSGGPGRRTRWLTNYIDRRGGPSRGSRCSPRWARCSSPRWPRPRRSATTRCCSAAPTRRARGSTSSSTPTRRRRVDTREAVRRLAPAALAGAAAADRGGIPATAPPQALAVVRRARARLRRAVRPRRRAAGSVVTRPLRRALRADRDHRPRRVDRRDRRRPRASSSTPALIVARAARRHDRGRRSGGPTSTSSRSSPSALREARGQRPERASPATPTATCTSR